MPEQRWDCDPYCMAPTGSHHERCPAAAEPPASETVHACPEGASGVTPCCGRTPFELPPTDRMTVDGALVTCGRVPAAVPPGETDRPRCCEHPSSDHDQWGCTIDVSADRRVYERCHGRDLGVAEPELREQIADTLAPWTEVPTTALLYAADAVLRTPAVRGLLDDAARVARVRELIAESVGDVTFSDAVVVRVGAIRRALDGDGGRRG